MHKDISNLEIEKTLQKIGNDAVNKNFISVFLSDKMNKFINFHQVMKAKGAKYPFLISNMDRSYKEGTHCWGISDNHPKTEIFFFDLFGAAGPKSFIIQEDNK